MTNTKNFILYSDEYGEDEYAYWESLGIRKEMHDFSDKAGKWATFTPMDVYAEENEGKTWPVASSVVPSSSSLEPPFAAHGITQIKPSSAASCA